MAETLFQIDSTAEEADQKIVQHTLHSIKTMHNEIEVQSTNTDVLALLLAYIAMEMEESDHKIFSVFFELVTSSPTWYDIVYLINQTGIDICKALSFFQCFTSSPSSFNGKGKYSFFYAWMQSDVKDDITKATHETG